jgi:hypothetical protein
MGGAQSYWDVDVEGPQTRDKVLSQVRIAGVSPEHLLVNFLDNGKARICLLIEARLEVEFDPSKVKVSKAHIRAPSGELSAQALPSFSIADDPVYGAVLQVRNGSSAVGLRVESLRVASSDNGVALRFPGSS